MRSFSLLFAFIALIVLAQFLIYVVRGPVDPFIAAIIFISFLACAVPALYLLKPFEGKEDLENRRRQRKERRKQRERTKNARKDPSDYEGPES